MKNFTTPNPADDDDSARLDSSIFSDSSSKILNENSSKMLGDAPSKIYRDPPSQMLRPYAVEADSSGENAGSQSFGPAAILHAVRRNWLLGGVLGVLLSVPLATLAWIVVQPKFEVTTLIRISPQHVPLAFSTADHALAAGQLDFRNFKNTQRQLLLSPQILSNALKNKSVADLPFVQELEDPIAWLQDKLDITFPDEAEIMQVSLRLVDGVVAQKIVDAVVNTYYEDVVLADQNDRLKRIDNLERVRTDAENKTRARRAELRALVDTLGTSDSSTMNLAQQAAMHQYSLIRTELTKIRFELLRAEGEMENLPETADSNAHVADDSPADADSPATDVPKKPQDPSQPAEPSSQLEMKIAQLMETDPIGLRSQRDLVRYAGLIQQIESRLHPDHATKHVTKYRDKLDEAERKIAARKAELRTLMAESGILPDDTRRADLSREIAILKMQERRLAEELKEQEAEGKKIGRSSIDAEMMLQEVAGLDKVVTSLTDELERTKIEMKSKSRITILGPAQIPQVGNAKKRLPLTAAAGLFGLFGPLALLMAFDLRRQPVNGRETMTAIVRMPVLGSLPMVPPRAMKRIARNYRSTGNVWRRRLDESVASITSLLLHKLESEGHRVILVTSAKAGEGKSTLVAQLAASLADSGHSTLLIDFDLRRPILHDYFGLPLAPGVTDVLRGGTELEQAVQTGDHPNLRVLAAGNRLPGSLLQDAASGSLKALFVTARANYEIVLVDSCPLLPVVDGRLVGQHTDGAILSVIKDVSKLPQISAACSIMSDYGIPALGCVVTGDNNDFYYSAYTRADRDVPVTA